MKKRFFAPIVIGFLLFSFCKTSSSSVVNGDLVISWNLITINATKKAGLNSNLATRIDAIEAIAVYDAVNSIKNYGTPYHISVNVSGKASAQAAAVQAAYTVLSHYFPDQKVFLDSALTSSISQIKEDGISNGQSIGSAAANDIIALRANDGSNPNMNYTSPSNTGVGVYCATPPAFAPGINQQWANLKPFLLTESKQFRPAPPPSVGSADYNTALAMVKDLGSATSTSRTSEQTHIGQFYKQDVELTVNEVARLLAQSNKSTLEETALVFALTDIAEADARIAVWDAKYFYLFWRPVTALNANADGSVGNNYADWSPLISTPTHPCYPSGHTATVTAGFEVLKKFYGDNNTLTLHTTTAGEDARIIKSLSIGEAENADSRIYVGVHFTFDNTASHKIGQQVANFVLANGPKKR